MIVRMLVGYLAALTAFLAVDLVWLGIVARGFYRDAFAAAGLAVEIDMPVAIAFYAFYVIGIVIFAVAPALGRAILAARGVLRRAVRALRLCDLRPHQHGDAEGLARVRLGRRHPMGRFPSPPCRRPPATPPPHRS